MIDEVVLKLWAARYRGFSQKRYVASSRGGGDWPALKKRTIARRRKGKGKGGPQILVDTGTLKNALDFKFTRAPGQFQQFLRGGKGLVGVRVGFGGPMGHPDAEMTVAKLATIHNEGLGNVPKREIIVQPDKATLDGMVRDVEKRWRVMLRGRV